MQSKLVVTTLGAFGLGALVSWAITADIYEKRSAEERAGYDELISDKTEHIFALKDQLRDFDPNLFSSGIVKQDPGQDYIEFRSTESDEPIRIIEVPDEEVPEGETPEQTRSNLQAIIDTYTADPETRAEFTDMAISAEEYDKSPPFVISRADYAYGEEGEHHEKITLTYYMRDRVLLDDDEDPIDDVPGTIGWRNLSQFGGESEDPNVVFVRNRHMMTDFEVVKEDDSELPLHIKYGMGKEEFRVNKAAGLIKLRREDE